MSDTPCRYCGTPIDSSTDDGCGCDGERVADLEAEVARLREKYQEAIYDIGDWASYAPDYFKAKHDLDGCIAAHTAELGDGDDFDDDGEDVIDTTK